MGVPGRRGRGRGGRSRGRRRRRGPGAGLITYVEQALDALGVRRGPTRAEVVVTPEGPAPVEVGTRIAGATHPAFHTVCAGGDQATLTALAYQDPGRFLADHAGRRYRRLREAVCRTTTTTRSGPVDSIDEDAVAELAALGTWPPESVLAALPALTVVHAGAPAGHPSSSHG
ncbi:hypothetical protein AB0M64_32380 [Streptomyces sp. NPDC051771]|uniref:hypothetical protein n=1 Tax=Streptomyces sp. NPDC051771 TaxID=3154847 RepID=UPI003440F0B2